MLPFSTTFHQESNMDSMLLVEDLSDDDSSCDIIISWCFYLIKKHSQELLKSEADLEGSVRDVLTISAFVCLLTRTVESYVFNE
jgi:hypothetical protein